VFGTRSRSAVWARATAALRGAGRWPFARKRLTIWTFAAVGKSAAVRDAGLTIAFAPGAMVPSQERISAGRVLAWMRRQMTITRVYNGRMWRSALLAHIFYCGGMAASIAASIRGHRLAEWALIVQLSPGMLKGLNRATLAKAALPECEAWFKRHLWVHAIWVPLATWLWLIVLISSAFGNSITWRGYQYKL
jgi:hypothetical protein